MSKEQSEAEKAAEEHKAKIIAEDDIEARRLGCSTSRYFPADMLRTSFLAGAAWAAPKWKCPPEYPNEGDLIVIKRVDEDDSWTYHLSRSRRSIPIMSTWMLIEPAAPEVEK